jgi:shikimate kinase
MQHLDGAESVRPEPTAATAPHHAEAAQRAAFIRSALGRRSVVLVGMMGAGKSSVGRRLAQALDLPFTDADAEIEAAAGGMTISEIFATHGEPYFRAREARVLERLLGAGPQVLATGGGAWMNPSTRAGVAANGVSVWLKAELDVLLRRVRKRGNRPLLASGNPEATLRDLVAARSPIYALADVTVTSREAPHEQVVVDLLGAIHAHLSRAERP